MLPDGLGQGLLNQVSTQAGKILPQPVTDRVGQFAGQYANSALPDLTTITNLTPNSLPATNGLSTGLDLTGAQTSCINDAESQALTNILAAEVLQDLEKAAQNTDKVIIANAVLTAAGTLATAPGTVMAVDLNSQ